MSDIKIKISELESGDNLTRSIIDSAVIPIAVGALDSKVGETYKITLGEHYYDKDYINNQFNWIQEYVNKKISGIDVPDEYDDTSITGNLAILNEHIARLGRGALVDTISYNDSDTSGYPEIRNCINILYNTLNSNKILISNARGRIDVYDMDPESLEILKGWKDVYNKDITENGVTTNVVVSLVEKIQELENKISALEDEAKKGPYLGSSYTKSEELNMMDATPIEVKKDGILSLIPYYSHSTGVFDIFINGTFVTQTYQVYGDGHSHAGCCIPVKKGDIIEIKKIKGKQASQRAYIIY